LEDRSLYEKFVGLVLNEGWVLVDSVQCDLQRVYVIQELLLGFHVEDELGEVVVILHLVGCNTFIAV